LEELFAYNGRGGPFWRENVHIDSKRLDIHDQRWIYWKNAEPTTGFGGRVTGKRIFPLLVFPSF